MIIVTEDNSEKLMTNSAILRKLERVVTRIDERLNNFINTYKEDKLEQKAEIEKLCTHVNHELNKIDERIKIMENIFINQKNEIERKKIEVKKLKIIIGSVTAIIIAIVTTLRSIGIF